MCFSLVQAHCSRTLLITAVLNTSWSFKRNGACSMGRTLWAVLSITKGVVAARWQWQRLLGCSGPWHSGPITISEGKKQRKKTSQTIPSPLEECDAICSQVWLIPAEQSRPHHTNECRQEITKGARLSLFRAASCFHYQIILHFFPPSECVCVTQMLFFFLSKFLSACNGTLQEPFPLAARSESFVASEAQAVFKGKTLWRPVSR